MIQAEKSVSRIVTGMTMATTIPSRQPMASNTSAMIDTVARPRWNSSSFDFSFAVSP